MYLPRRGERDPITAVVIFGIPLLYCFCIVFYYSKRAYETGRKQRNASKRGQLTESPIVPYWLQMQQSEGRISRIMLSDVLVQCHSYAITANWKSAISWAQQAMDIYGNKNRTGFQLLHELPKNACTVSIPMKNFKCGECCTDFVPLSGKSPDCSYLYQLIGNHRFQLVFYLKDEMSYPAGVCIYIESPYLEGIHYNEQILQFFANGPKFRDATAPPQELENAADPGPPEPRTFTSVTKNLKSEFCKTQKRQVLLGVEDGATWHFESLNPKKNYRISGCPTCKIEEESDNPPAYDAMFS